MTSEKQISANRQNALQSTGPHTPEGKAIVSRNATRHGILSKEIPFNKNEGKVLEEFRLRFYEELCPKGEYENLLVDRVVSSAWRLSRIIQVETTMFAVDISQSFKGNAKDSMSVLSRYELVLEKSLYRAYNELQRLQTMRKEATAETLEIIDYQKVDGDKNGFVS